MVLFVVKKMYFLTNNDSAYESAISLSQKGIKVQAIIDIREKTNSSIIKQAEDLGIKIYWSHTVVDTTWIQKIKKNFYNAAF